MAKQVKYHRAILSLLEVEAKLDSDRLAVIEERERVCGVRFPDSVREWFGVPDAGELFFHNSNNDHLAKVGELGDPAETSQDYLRVAVENQGVVAWYVRLSEGDDPPVYNNNDEWEEDMSTIDWRSNSASFTNFVFDMITQNHFGGWYSGRFLTAREEEPPTEGELARLREWFQEGPTTNSPNFTVYRFFTTEGVVVVRTSHAKNRENQLTEWSVDARSRESLVAITRPLWSLGTLSQTLEHRGCTPIQGGRATAEEVLEELRGELGDS